MRLDLDPGNTKAGKSPALAGYQRCLGKGGEERCMHTSFRWLWILQERTCTSPMSTGLPGLLRVLNHTPDLQTADVELHCCPPCNSMPHSAPSPTWIPAAREADFHWQGNQPIVVQFVLCFLDVLSTGLLLPSPLTSTWRRRWKQLPVTSIIPNLQTQTVGQMGEENMWTFKEELSAPCPKCLATGGCSENKRVGLRPASFCTVQTLDCWHSVMSFGSWLQKLGDIRWHLRKAKHARGWCPTRLEVLWCRSVHWAAGTGLGSVPWQRR